MDNDDSKLFLDAAVRSSRTTLHGGVVLQVDKSTRIITIALAICLTMIIIAAAAGTYSRFENVRGTLQTKSQTAKILALRPGVIVAINVIDGQFVRKGQALATVRVDQLTTGGHTPIEDQLVSVLAQQAITQAQGAAVRARAQGERENSYAQITSSKQQITELENQLQLQGNLIANQEQSYARYAPLLAKGFVTQIDMDKKYQELLAAKQVLNQINQRLTDAKGEVARATAQIHQSIAEERGAVLASSNAAETLKIQKSQIEGERAYVLAAPISGTVTALQAGVGRTVDASHPLMAIVPEKSELHAEFYAPSKAVGFVRVGQDVRLLYDAFPYDHFGAFHGKVKGISKTALDPKDINMPVDGNDLLYRVDVELPSQSVVAYGNKNLLQPGMSLSGDIILEKRSFADWLFEPLYAVRRRS